MSVRTYIHRYFVGILVKRRRKKYHFDISNRLRYSTALRKYVCVMLIGKMFVLLVTMHYKI